MYNCSIAGNRDRGLSLTSLCFSSLLFSLFFNSASRVSRAPPPNRLIPSKPSVNSTRLNSGWVGQLTTLKQCRSSSSIKLLLSLFASHGSSAFQPSLPLLLWLCPLLAGPLWRAVAPFYPIESPAQRRRQQQQQQPVSACVTLLPGAAAELDPSALFARVER